MSGDYSRIRFDPRKHFANVLMQQGRVQLDSDWNEMAAVFDRRFRAQLADTLGRFVVPRRTPDAFAVARVGERLTIGPGRMYVDGLMPENHGAGPQVVDPVLHEPRGSQPIDYATGQPYFPPALVPALPVADGQIGPILVYLDTWQRDVTHVEDPDIVEPAVGIDTATRTQIAWRVRFLADPALATAPTLAQLDPIAGDPPAYWADLTRPPAGRLTTRTDDVGDKNADPCIIPPSGGFRGLENQLYRVEIHDSGAPGKATFKWSRDNASVASAVTAVNLDTNALTVASVGRDAVLSFAEGQYVELLDDLQEPDGVRGVMLLVRRVDDDARLIEFDPATKIPAALAGTAAELAARRTRVRRWDQRDTKIGGTTVALAESGGVLPIPEKGGPIVLEHGVVVEFSVADDKARDPFRAGDHWVFAARTATADIDRLTEAPPHGHHHHYAPLAYVHGDDLVDLRRKWPDLDDAGDGECDIHVDADAHNRRDGTIQDAINDLRDRGGGTICLGRGVFFITDDTLRIEGFPGPLGEDRLPRRGITIRGRGAQTVLIRQFTVERRENEGVGNFPLHPDFEVSSFPREFTDRSLLRIHDAADVTLSDLVLVSSGAAAAAAPAVSARTVAGLTIERCFFLHLGPADAPTLTPAIGLGGAIAGASVRDNVFVASVGLGLDGTADARSLLVADLTVADNTFSCSSNGVDLSFGFVVHARRTRVVGNDIACGGRGVHVAGLVHAAGLVEIADNTIDAGTDGVVAEATRILVRHNTVHGPQGRALADPLLDHTPEGKAPLFDPFFLPPLNFEGDARIHWEPVLPVGLLVRRGTDPHVSCRLVGNTVRGFSVGVLCDNRVDDLVIRDNLLEDLRQAGVAFSNVPRNYGTRATIADNRIRDIGATLRTHRSVLGIWAFGCAELTIEGNTFERIGRLPADYPLFDNEFDPTMLRGIRAEVGRVLVVRGNLLRDVGQVRALGRRRPGSSLALEIRDINERVDVSGNTVTHTNPSLVEVACGGLSIFVSPTVGGSFIFFADAVILEPVLQRAFRVSGNRIEVARTRNGLGGPALSVVAPGFDLGVADNQFFVFGTDTDPGAYVSISSVRPLLNTDLAFATARFTGNSFQHSIQGVGRLNVSVNSPVAGLAVGNSIVAGNFTGNFVNTPNFVL